MAHATKIKLNSKLYVIKGNVRRETIPDYTPAYRTTSTERQSDRTGASRHTFTFEGGFAADRIDFAKPETLNKVYNSDNDTRFGFVVPPYLVNTATIHEEAAADTHKITAMENFGGNLYAFGGYVDDSAANYDLWCWEWDADAGGTHSKNWEQDGTHGSVIVHDLATYIITAYSAVRHGQYLFVAAVGGGWCNFVAQ